MVPKISYPGMPNVERHEVKIVFLVGDNPTDFTVTGDGYCPLALIDNIKNVIRKWYEHDKEG